MNKSRRHHYVPQFMTKYFSDDKEQINVYDKINDRFYKNSAINLFVENDRNTFPNLEGIEDDVIERVYSSLDTQFSNVLTEITNSGKVSNENFKQLLFLAYISKWRVPRYDESFEKAKEHYSVDDLGLGFKDSDNERIEINLEDYFELDMQQEMKRLLLAIQPFRFKMDFKQLIKSSFLINTPIDSFISDCPFNEATIISDEIFEDFVFPITRDLTLVYSKRINVTEIQDFILNGEEKNVHRFLKEFSFARDVSMLELAERNVACSDLDYLKHVVNTYKVYKAKGTDTAYNLTVFNVLYRFKEYTDLQN
nr:DUF4238 domain-containing protein [uncultured Draconibacterium sp.]